MSEVHPAAEIFGRPTSSTRKLRDHSLCAFDFPKVNEKVDQQPDFLRVLGQGCRCHSEGSDGASFVAGVRLQPCQAHGESHVLGVLPGSSLRVPTSGIRLAQFQREVGGQYECRWVIAANFACRVQQ